MYHVSSPPSVRVFAISELVDNICALLDYGSLASLAVTSRLVHEPSIRFLWEDLESFELLASCLPEDACVFNGELIVRFHWRFCLSMISKHLDRISLGL